MMDSSEDGDSSDDSAAHASEMSGGSDLEATFKAQEATLVTRHEGPNFVCPNSQWVYLQCAPPRRDLGVSDVGGDSDNDDDNSDSGHSVTGQRFAAYEDVSVGPPARVSEKLLPPSTGVANAEAPSVQHPSAVCVAQGMLGNDAHRALNGNSNNELSLPLSQRLLTRTGVTDVEDLLRALPQAGAPAVAGPTLDGSPVVVLGIVCDEGNGKDDATFFLLTMRTADSTCQAWAPPRRGNTCAIGGQALEGPPTAALGGACDNINGKHEATSFALPARQVIGRELEDARAVDGPAVDAEPAAAVGGASDEGDALTRPSFALTSRETRRPVGSRSNPRCRPHPTARAPSMALLLIPSRRLWSTALLTATIRPGRILRSRRCENAADEAGGTEKPARGDWSVWEDEGKRQIQEAKIGSLRSEADAALRDPPPLNCYFAAFLGTR